MTSKKAFLNLLILLIVLIEGCTTKIQDNRAIVSDQIKKQYGYALRDSKISVQTQLPPGVDVANGISAEEAVSLALFNNLQYQADLASITISQADLVEAGMMTNPVLRYLLPAGGINVSGYINFALDYLWQRPKRIALANSDIRRISESMIQKGYGLIRDVQTLYADLLLSRERARILFENVLIKAEMNQLSNSRLRNGEISELEASTARADSASAVDEYLKASLDTTLRNNHLKVLIGYSADTTIYFEEPVADLLITQGISLNDYLQLAYENNPELKSAQLAIESSGRRIGWERTRIFAFIATLNFQHIDGNSGSKLLPNALNPGFQVEIPVLNRNQGRIMRAKAELEQASLQYMAIRQRIALDVSDVYYRYTETHKSYRVWNNNVIPSLEEAVRLVRIAFRRGDISYLPVLEAMRQLLNGKLRKAEIEADLRKSISQLNFVLGKKTEIK